MISYRGAKSADYEDETNMVPDKYESEVTKNYSNN